MKLSQIKRLQKHLVKLTDVISKLHQLVDAIQIDAAKEKVTKKKKAKKKK